MSSPTQIKLLPFLKIVNRHNNLLLLLSLLSLVARKVNANTTSETMWIMALTPPTWSTSTAIQHS
jgi:hypothetical protein